MKILSYGKDGGKDSVVWGFWLIEIKPLFSITLLCFEDGSREAYHSHAFNSISWVIKGRLEERILDGPIRKYTPSPRPLFTYRDTFHKVFSFGRTWVLTFRGPWKKTWKEFLPETKEVVTLTNGRKILKTTDANFRRGFFMGIDKALDIIQSTEEQEKGRLRNILVEELMKAPLPKLDNTP